MKQSLSLIAAFAAVSFAGPVKFGADVLAGYNILSVGDSLKQERAASFGFGVGPSATYFINDQLGIHGGISFLYDINRLETSMDLGPLGSVTSKQTITLMSLGFQIAPTYQITEKFSAKLGYEWDMPLGGSVEIKQSGSGILVGDTTIKRDAIWAPAKASSIKKNQDPFVSTNNIVLGASYSLSPNLAISLQGKFALNGIGAEYKDNGNLKGASASKDNISVHQVALGVNYSFN